MVYLYTGPGQPARTRKYPKGIVLNNKDLRGENFNNVILEDITMVGADLRGVDFSGSELKNVNLYNANLDNTNFNVAILSSVDLGNASLKNAKLFNTTVKNTSLVNADLSGANLQYAQMFNLDMSNANLTKANTDSVKFSSVNLANVEGLHHGKQTTKVKKRRNKILGEIMGDKHTLEQEYINQHYGGRMSRALEPEPIMPPSIITPTFGGNKKPKPPCFMPRMPGQRRRRH